MIPFAIPAVLKALPWRIIGAGVLVLVIAACGWRVSVWRDAYNAYPKAVAALEAEQACADGSKCYERQRALQEAAGHATVVAVESYEAELAELRSRPPVRRVIRVCPNPGPGDVSVPGTAGPADGPAAGPGVVHGSYEFDTEPLRDLAREADELSARLRALQEYSRAVSQPPH